MKHKMKQVKTKTKKKILVIVESPTKLKRLNQF